MGHDPEGDAARFLGAAMTPEQRADFSEHMLRCDACWQEVSQAERGRRLAEAGRVVAPPAVRERMRAVAQGTGQEASLPAIHRRRRVHAALAAAAALIVAVAIAVPLVASGSGPADPAALRAAVADFTARELPGTQLPATAPPDLSALRLRAIGAGAGQYDGLDVDAYAYRDDVGRRVVLYLSDEPFPTADGAQSLAGPDGPWVVRRGDVVVLCARSPHALLVVGQDDQLVRSTAVALGVT
jgi:hypothetical protein